MSRQNLCPNPAQGTNTTGWATNGGFVRVTDVVGLPVATGWRLLAPASNGYAQTPTGVASPAVEYTASCYVSNYTEFSTSRPVYLAWTRSAGGDDFSQVVSTSLPIGVTRVSLTRTAPANATGLYLIIDTLSPGFTPGVSGWDVTAVLYEASADLGTYFDGDTVGATWDGTADNSTSTYSDVVVDVAASSTPTAAGRRASTAAVSGRQTSTVALTPRRSSTASVTGG